MTSGSDRRTVMTTETTNAQDHSAQSGRCNFTATETTDEFKMSHLLLWPRKVRARTFTHPL